jgi:MFS family permease
VNFILDTDYVGLKTHAQAGMTEYGDGRTWETGAAFGHDFGNGLHLLGSIAAFDQSPVSSFGIPVYYPGHVGAVGGLVGMIGGLGGFILPIAFGAMNDLTGVWTSCFMLLFALVGMALLWMHFAIRRMERARLPELETLPELPEMVELHPPGRTGATQAAMRQHAMPAIGHAQRAS